MKENHKKENEPLHFTDKNKFACGKHPLNKTWCEPQKTPEPAEKPHIAQSKATAERPSLAHTLRKAPAERSAAETRRPPRERRKAVNKIKYELRKLKKCSTKYALKKFLTRCSGYARGLLLFYMRECFVFDIFTRRLECKKYLMSKRQFLFRIIEDPRVLDSDCHFNNNILKNFCTGIANFLIRHMPRVVACFELRGYDFFDFFKN